MSRQESASKSEKKKAFNMARYNFLEREDSGTSKEGGEGNNISLKGEGREREGEKRMG